MTAAEYEAEIARLHAFTVQLAEHLFLAAEVLAIRAEKRRSKDGEDSCEKDLDAARSE